MEAYKTDPRALKLLTTLAVEGSYGHYSLHQGFIKYKGRIWIGHNASIQTKIMATLHSSPIGGHSDFHVTYKKIKALYAWPGLKSMVKQYVAQCSVCQQAKTERVKYPGLLQPLPVPKFAW